MDTFVNVFAAIAAAIIIGGGLALFLACVGWLVKKILKSADIRLWPKGQQREPGTGDTPFGIDKPEFTEDIAPAPSRDQYQMESPVKNVDRGTDRHGRKIHEGQRPISIEELDRRWPHMSGEAQHHMRGEGYRPPEERDRLMKVNNESHGQRATNAADAFETAPDDRSEWPAHFWRLRATLPHWHIDNPVADLAMLVRRGMPSGIARVTEDGRLYHVQSFDDGKHVNIKNDQGEVYTTETFSTGTFIPREVIEGFKSKGF